MILKYFVKSLITNKNLWGWGIAFMVFWLALGAFVFYQKGSGFVEAKYFASSFYGVVALFSMGTLGTTIGFSIYYANSSLPYLFRFSKLKPHEYLFNFVVSSSIVSLFMAISLMLFNIAFFSISSGYILRPSFPIYIILISIASGLIMFEISLILLVFVNNFVGLKSISFVSFIPNYLAYAFGFSMLYIKLPSELIYFSPFSEIVDLFIYSYSGKSPYLVISNPDSSTVNVTFLAVMLLAWILVLFILSSIAIRFIKPRNMEEARQT